MGLIIIPGQGGEPEPGREGVVTIAPEEVDAWVRAAIAQNREVRRTVRSQEAVDRCVEVLHEEGEVYLAASILHLVALRVLEREGLGLARLMELAAELTASGATTHRCRVCGCTEDRACEGGCSWVEIDLCSACDRRLKRQARDAYKNSVLPGPGRDG